MRRRRPCNSCRRRGAKWGPARNKRVVGVLATKHLVLATCNANREVYFPFYLGTLYLTLSLAILQWMDLLPLSLKRLALLNACPGSTP